MSKKLVCLVSGGTGGHVFPAMALAEQLHKQHHYTCLLTESRGGEFSESENLTMVKRIPIVRKLGVLSSVVYPLSLAWSALYCLIMLGRMHPDVVVGFGGYPCVPVLIAARLLRIPYVVHESNSVLGRVNRAFAKGAKLLCTAYPNVKFAKAYEEKTVVTGSPVRSAIHTIRKHTYKLPIMEGYTAERHREQFNVLVIGGSQGAKIFSDVLPKAINRLPEGVKQNIYVQQQCRPENIDELTGDYRHMNITADIKPFFDDMHMRLSGAHLVVCRAGASTLAELAVAGRPAILVPYPYAADNHQYFNAQYFEQEKAAILLEQNDFLVERMYNCLQQLIDDKKRLVQMAKNMSRHGAVDAAANLSHAVLSVTIKKR